MHESLQALASAKVNETLSKIPAEWSLSQDVLDRAKSERKLKGDFFDSFLTPRELEITRYDSLSLVNRVRDGRLSAVEVTKAYCKAAAVAHQIVSVFVYCANWWFCRYPKNIAFSS